MALENLYFKHDFNARNDPKLIKIRRKLKLEGVAIYWYLIEFSYERNGYFNNEELEDFAWQNHLELDQVKEVLKLAGFKLNKDNNYYLDGVIKRIEKREEFCKKQSENAKKRWDKKKQAPVPDWYEKYEKDLEKTEIKKENKKLTKEEKENLQKIADEISGK